MRKQVVILTCLLPSPLAKQSLILAAVKQEKYARLIDVAVKYAKEQTSDKSKQLDLATDRLLVAFGVEILKIIPGKVSTEVDASLSFDTKASVEKALKIIEVGNLAHGPPNISQTRQTAYRFSARG